MYKDKYQFTSCKGMCAWNNSNNSKKQPVRYGKVGLIGHVIPQYIPLPYRVGNHRRPLINHLILATFTRSNLIDITSDCLRAYQPVITFVQNCLFWGKNGEIPGF